MFSTVASWQRVSLCRTNGSCGLCLVATAAEPSLNRGVERMFNRLDVWPLFAVGLGRFDNTQLLLAVVRAYLVQIVSGLSLALIENASGGTVRKGLKLDPRRFR
jgi:hypothetical protein